MPDSLAQNGTPAGASRRMSGAAIHGRGGSIGSSSKRIGTDHSWENRRHERGHDIVEALRESPRLADGWAKACAWIGYWSATAKHSGRRLVLSMGALGCLLICFALAEYAPAAVWSRDALYLCLAVPLVAFYSLHKRAVRCDMTQVAGASPSSVLMRTVLSVARLHTPTRGASGKKTKGVRLPDLASGMDALFDSATAIPVGHLSLACDTTTCAHPLVHAHPAAPPCPACQSTDRDTVVVRGVVCLTTRASTTATRESSGSHASHAVGVVCCLGCGHMAPGAWCRRPNDEQWTDAGDLVCPGGALPDKDERETLLGAETATGLFVRTTAAGYIAVPHHSRQTRMRCTLRLGCGESRQRAVVWTMSLRTQHWLRFYTGH